MREDPAETYGVDAARHYDATYDRLRSGSGDIDFYRALARDAGTGQPVLEIGCGSGRVLLPLARDGAAATGVDASPAMLALLRSKAPAEGLDVETVCARMEAFDLSGRTFPLVFSAFRAFQHLHEVSDQLACLERVRRHLAPGGVFAFDVFAPRIDLLGAGAAEREDARFPDPAGGEIVRFASVEGDNSAQQIHVTFRFERQPAVDGAPDVARKFHVTMRYFFRYELEHLLARAGFTAELFGGFDRRPWDGVSGETIIVARAR